MAFYTDFSIKQFLCLIFMIVNLGCAKKSSSNNSVNCSNSMLPSVDSAIQAALNSHPDTPGVVVAIYHPLYGYRQKAYGLENRNNATAMREDHIFDIGSVMKNFRWLVMHKLAEAGSLDLDDSINTHVASPVLGGRNLKHLMHHSTGMIDIPDSIFMADVSSNLTKTYTYNEMMAFLVGSNGAGYTNGLTDVFTVGTDYRYSSFGPLIAGEVVQGVSGKSMMTLVDELILSPLALQDTSFISYEDRPDKVAQGYDDATTEFHDMDNYADTRGYSSGFSGLMYSSACDLARYTNHQFNDSSFLSTATVSSMTTDSIVDGGIEIGLGVFKYSTWGNFWGHLGSSIHGHSSAIAHRTSDKLSIVVLANIDEGHDNYATHFAIVSAIGSAL